MFVTYSLNLLYKKKRIKLAFIVNSKIETLPQIRSRGTVFFLLSASLLQNLFTAASTSLHFYPVILRSQFNS